MNEPRRPLQKRDRPQASSKKKPPRSSASQRSNRDLPKTRSWIPAIAAVTVLAVVVLAGAFSTDDGGSGAVAGDTSTSTQGTDTATDTPTDDSSYGITGLTVPPSTLPAIGTDVSDPPVAKTNLSRSLVAGMSGPEVAAVQTRLTEMGFVPGAADGIFGDQTKQAVWAFEKLVLQTPAANATGRVTNEMWQRMQDPITIQPRRPGSGTHVEIYLPQQVAAVFTDNKATLVLHISSGSALTPERTPQNSWCEPITLTIDANGNPIPPEKQVAASYCGVSFTPGGVFRFTRKEQGHYVGALGGMDNPIYFNYGIAMHGAEKVPLTPASHGCIRMNKKISETFQNYVHLHDLVYVWGQDGKEPEQYTKKQSTPIFNYPDPSATTTTTLKPTTTTAKATTTTTVKPTTTTVKPSAATTTVVAAPVTTAAPTTTPSATTAVPTTTTEH